MKSKLNGKLKYVAIGVFLMALMFNVGITFTDNLGSTNHPLNVDLEMLARVEAQSEGSGSYNTVCVQDFIFICRTCSGGSYGYREIGHLMLC